MRILLCGGNGQLGRELQQVATAAGHEVRSTTHVDCDITDALAVQQTLDDAQPDVLINCAAFTHVDAAETHAEAAFLVNAFGPRVLAAECAARDVLLVHLSTDYVFDGSATEPIDEAQTPAPRSVYGASKLVGENGVRALARRYQVVRTSWLYGNEGPNFVLNIQRAAADGRELRVVSDQVGGPTWTGHLAPALLRLIERDEPGTYHLSNAGEVSWHGLAEEVVALSGKGTPVTPVATADYPTVAPRPRYSVLENRAWRLLGEPPLPEWRDGLSSYLASRELEGAAGV